MRRIALALVIAGCGTPDGAAGPPADAPDRCEAAVPWASAPPLAIGPTQETAAVAVDGTVYILGGFNTGDGIVPTVQTFDPATCRYGLAPPLPRPVHHVTAAVLDRTIFVLGALETPGFIATGDTWSWTVGDAAWTARAAMPAGTERGAAVAGAIDGKLVVAGGLRGGAAVDDVSTYDPIADAWTAGPPLPAPRDHACGAAIDGALYVAGGREATLDSNAATVFALAGGAWTTRAAMPTARGGTACGVVGGRLIVVGGEGNPAAASGVFPQVEAFDPAADAWQALPEMPTPRHGMAAAAVDGKLYVPGGATRQGFGAVATHEILTP